MKSRNTQYLNSLNKFRLIIESLVETIEMYNYTVRFYGKIDANYFSPKDNVNDDVSFVFRVELYEEGPEEGNNGTCTFFDELSQQDLNIFLELSSTERQRLTGLLKEALHRGNQPKFLLELENAVFDESEDKENTNFSSSISRNIVNIKFEFETGTKRNYFS